MPAPKRRSLRSLEDRNRDAMNAAPPGDQAPEKPAAAQASESSPEPPPARQTRKVSSAAEVARETPAPQQPTTDLGGPSNPIGIYIHRETFDNAKSAYLVDRRGPAPQDSLARWIAAAIVNWSALTPDQRQHAADALPPEIRQGAGSNRSFSIAATAVEIMADAMAADQDQYRVQARSQFITEAIRHAAEQARERNGGTLPPAPQRLPNRL